MLPDDTHQIINLSLAGVRSPRASGREGEPAEPWGDEARFFTESRIGQRAVRVILLALPAPTGVPFSNAGSAPSTAASIMIGVVQHPAGNIAEHLVAAGLARVVDWHAGMLSASGGMERLRAAERYLALTLCPMPILAKGSHQCREREKNWRVRQFGTDRSHNKQWWSKWLVREVSVRSARCPHLEWRSDRKLIAFWPFQS